MKDEDLEEKDRKTAGGGCPIICAIEDGVKKVRKKVLE